MALKIKNILSNEKYQNIVLLFVILIGVAISFIVGSNSCNNITPFVEAMFIVENYYFGIIGIVVIALTVGILIDKAICLMKRSDGENYIMAKHGRYYVFIVFLFLLSTLMYVLSTPICKNSSIFFLS